MYKVKVFDEAHEKDLENAVNSFLSTLESDIIEVQFQVGVGVFSDEQLYCFSAMIVYEDN